MVEILHEAYEAHTGESLIALALEVGDLLKKDENDREIRAQDYGLDQLANETGLDVETLQRWARALERKGQTIIYGPPGTGKTYVAERLARHIVSGTDGFVEIVQFHPAYAYEDFVAGIRPRPRQVGD